MWRYDVDVFFQFELLVVDFVVVAGIFLSILGVVEQQFPECGDGYILKVNTVNISVYIILFWQ